MANAAKGEVTITAGGETYRLAFTTNAMCEVEDATGKSINAVLAEMSNPERVGIRELRLLLWASLTEHHPDITIRDAGRICDEIGAGGVGDLIGRAVEQAFPPAEPTAGKPKASRKSTG